MEYLDWFCIKKKSFVKQRGKMIDGGYDQKQRGHVEAVVLIRK